MTESNDTTASTTLMSDKLYGFLKAVALVWLPALATLYFTMGGLWHLPNVEQVVGSITAIDTFLGVILGISTRAYNASDSRFDGNIVIGHAESGAKLYSLELNVDPDEIDTKNDITFKVVPPSKDVAN